MEPELFMARLAEQAERYEDVFSFLTPVLQSRDHFTPEERSMLSVAFKNLITPRRTTWRTINAIEQSQGSAAQSEAINKYKAVIEQRLHTNCSSIVELLTEHVIPRVEKRYRDKQIKKIEERAFFYKMVGDYNRYASESASSAASKTRLPTFKEGALDAYSKSLELCSRQDSGMKAYNSVRLGLALNFSVFHYEIMGDAKQACEIAKTALEAAIEVIDECSEDVFQEA